jgi:selenocysteine lyase/cysteine desulfurase
MDESDRSVTEPDQFRARFPVCERVSYLNAGTEGPVPARAAKAVHERVDFEAQHGRCGSVYFETTKELASKLRDGYAGVLGCEASEVALTGSTTDGVNTVLSALALHEGDEVLTSDEEHPGLLAPLGRARRVHGVEVRVVPFAELANEVRPATRLVACSHVSWVSGQVADVAAMSSTGIPILLDAAQGLGAVPVDVRSLGCDFYAASGQKWLCGPEGSGCLFVRRERLDELLIPWPGYGSLADAERALELEPAEGAARFDLGFPPGLRSTWALAALEVFEEAGWDWVHERSSSLAVRLAEQLARHGLEVRDRGRSTLVSWQPPSGRDPAEEVQRLANEGIVVRSIPGFGGLIRASVGAWSSEEELERLAEVASQ